MVMPFSHHSHSGQFCPGHARNTLEEMIRTAISKELRIFALTEHMPRHDIDLYPEEKSTGWNLDRHFTNEAEFYTEAIKLRERYKKEIEIPIGFEAEWIRPESLTLIQRSLKAHDYDFFVGSVHHVHTIPIDYTDEDYERARERSGGTDEKLFEDYFDWHYEMLKALRPPVVGHFDLIRLKSKDPNATFKIYPGVWQKILRNLDFIKGYDGLLEINSSALRKGLTEPYPKEEICNVFFKLGGKFCLSDDSHGINEVALNYGHVRTFVQDIGIKEVFFVRPPETKDTDTEDKTNSWTRIHAVSFDDIRHHKSWS